MSLLLPSPAAAIDTALERTAEAVLNALAARRRASPYALALAVPGLCHAHGPDPRAAVPGCAYCARRGNCFSSAGN